MTRQQKAVLDFIRDRLEATGIAPSYDEIRDKLGLKSKSNIVAFVNRLVERGHLVRIPHRPRSLALPTLDLASVPTARLVDELKARGWSEAA